jgi:hypothetical protein
MCVVAVMNCRSKYSSIDVNTETAKDD